MTTLRMTCSDCGRDTEVTVGENVRDLRIAWFRSLACSDCGNRIEEDGWDSTPDDSRNSLLENEGQFGLRLDLRAGDNKTISALKVLRSALDISLTEISGLRHSFLGIVAKGTKAEMLRLVQLLNAKGIAAAIETTPFD